MGTSLITQGGSHGSMSGNNSAANFGGECLPRQVSDPCAYVRANPACAAEGLDYLRFIECPTDANDGAAKVVLLIGWCAVLFLAIGTVGDAFFAPAVERIALRLRLPDDVAGATLLALGGAAPDIFTQIAALVESDEPDLKLALSESIGAGLFVATFGKALAVLVGLAWEAKRHERDGSHDPNTEHTPHSQQGVSVEPFPYVRDVVAYAFMLVLSLVAMSSKTVSWQLSSALVLSYVLYVCVVCFGWGRTKLEPALVRLAGGGGGVSGERPGESDSREMRTVDAEIGGSSSEMELSSAGTTPRARRTDTGDDDDDEATLLPSSRGDGGGVGSSSSGADGIPDDSSSGLPSFASVSLAAIVDWARVESGLADEVDGVGFPALVAAPVLLAMSATMARLTPRGGCQRIRPYHLLLICFVAPVFAMGAGMGTLGSFANNQPALLACGLSAWYTYAVWWVFRSGKVGVHGVDPAASPYLTALTFFQGIVWMHLCADELVGLFQAAGRAAGVRESLLGATFMSWGASAGDLGGTLAVARRGSTRMAVTVSLFYFSCMGN